MLPRCGWTWSRTIAPVGLGILLLVMGGCDWWPPALQSQIEQLQTDLQTLTVERTRLEQQVSALTRAREDLQTRVNQLVQVNKERGAAIAELERSLKAARQQKASSVKVSSLKPKTSHAAKSKTASQKATKKKPVGTKPKPRP
jgi:peptidoglycan hydrolase CwlO-like protein